MVFSPLGLDNAQFGLLRSSDGFDSVVDKTSTLEMMLKQLEYMPDKQPYVIKIVTSDDEKYEIEPVAPTADIGEKIENCKI